MRLKPVPEPPGALDGLERFQRAVPLVPGSTDDCCVRLRDRCDLPNRQVANDWLAFLRALGLVRETSRGLVRTDAAPTPERVRDGLYDGILLVPETMAALRVASPADPLRAEDLFEATRESVPRHERARDPSWEDPWRERAGRLLDWLALVDLAERVDRGPEADTDPEGADPPAYVAGDAA